MKYKIKSSVVFGNHLPTYIKARDTGVALTDCGWYDLLYDERKKYTGALGGNRFTLLLAPTEVEEIGTGGKR